MRIGSLIHIVDTDQAIMGIRKHNRSPDLDTYASKQDNNSACKPMT